MKAPSSLMPCFFVLSLFCHIALIIWYPNQQWLEGMQQGDLAARLQVSIIVDKSTAGINKAGKDKGITSETRQTLSATGYSPKVHDQFVADTAQRRKAMQPVKTGVVSPSEQEPMPSATLVRTRKMAKPASVAGESDPVKRGALAKPGSQAVDPDKDITIARSTALPHKKKQSLTNIKAAAYQTAIASGIKFAEKKPVAAQNRRYQLGTPQTPKPKYPRIAVSRRWQGEVLIAMQVKADGTPARVTVEKGSGFAVLDNSALKVLAKWRLAPSSNALETLYIPIIFRL